MRIVAGSARGRRIEAPPGRDTRPTTDRVREAVFNALGSMRAIEGSTAIDAFAGSGALGLEALSRGAGHVIFIDSDRRARQAIESNLRTLGFEDRSTVLSAEAVSHLRGAEPADLLLCDPPYAFDDWTALIDASPAPIVVCESDRVVEPPPEWVVAKQKRYGTTVVTIVTAARSAKTINLSE